MILAIAYTQRSLLAEQRTSSNLIRSAQAFEAAEAGLEWALALLNDNRRVGADCLPATDATAASFRDRMLQLGADAAVAPITWDDAGIAVPLEAACVRKDDGWACSCPTGGRPTLSVPSGPAAAPAFVVRFAASPRGGQVRAIATGCTSLKGACAASSAAADATAHVEVAFGLLAGLRRAPAAALTVHGAVDADTSAWSADNGDPASTGLAVLAGGTVAAGAARLAGAAGAPPAAAVVARDTALAGLDGDAFFAAVFGMRPARWAAQAAVATITCASGCAAAIGTAVAAGGANPLFDVRGDLELDAPLVLGSASRPVVIVVHGAVRLNGAVVVHGVLHGDSIAWSGSGGTLRGAALADGDFRSDGTPAFVYDGGVLARLANGTGTFARVAGSWRDF